MLYENITGFFIENFTIMFSNAGNIEKLKRRESNSEILDDINVTFTLKQPMPWILNNAI